VNPENLNPEVWWYVARAGGIVAWVLLAAAVVWGVVLSTRLLGRRTPPAWLLGVHRYLGGLAVVFTVVHLVGLVADSYVDFGWAEILVPYASSWRPGAVAVGVVALYLLVAVEVSSLLMRRLPRRVWRWIHLSGFALFGVATWHGIAAGTDVGNLVYAATSILVVNLVLGLTLVRILAGRRAAARSVPAQRTRDPRAA
jgi:predicted ferric reductase